MTDKRIAKRPAGEQRQPETVEQFVRRVVFAGVPDDVIAYVMLLSQRYDLDPLLHLVVVTFKTKAGPRHVPFIKRDGLLHIAHRSGLLDGIRFYYGTDELGLYAEAEVRRKDMQYPVVARAYMHEYDTGQNAWERHKLAMLAKVAVVMALRHAFDVALNAIEEMDRALADGQGEVIEAEPVADTATASTSSAKTEAEPWTYNQELLLRLVDGAQKHWSMSARPHVINRLARALGLPNPGGGFAEFARLMREQYAGTPSDAWKAVTSYQTPEASLDGAVVSWDEETPEGDETNE
jgi:hypothetical protein